MDTGFHYQNDSSYPASRNIEFIEKLSAIAQNKKLTMYLITITFILEV